MGKNTGQRLDRADQPVVGDILTSTLIDQLAEYNVPGKQIGHGKFTGTLTVTSPAPQPSESDSAIQHMLQHQIVANSARTSTRGNTLYFIYVSLRKCE